jgi:hypothetical protein
VRPVPKLASLLQFGCASIAATPAPQSTGLPGRSYTGDRSGLAAVGDPGPIHDADGLVARAGFLGCTFLRLQQTLVGRRIARIRRAAGGRAARATP